MKCHKLYLIKFLKYLPSKSRSIFYLALRVLPHDWLEHWL